MLLYLICSQKLNLMVFNSYSFLFTGLENEWWKGREDPPGRRWQGKLLSGKTAGTRAAHQCTKTVCSAQQLRCRASTPLKLPWTEPRALERPALQWVKCVNDTALCRVIISMLFLPKLPPLHCICEVQACLQWGDGAALCGKGFSGGLQLFTPFALGAVRSIAAKIEGGRFSCRWSGHISNLNKFF